MVIGNPPYRRVERNMAGRGAGRWLLDGKVRAVDQTKVSLMTSLT